MGSPVNCISLRQLQAAVRAALEETRKRYPSPQFAPLTEAGNLVLDYRPWIICGYPVPYPNLDLNDAAEFAKTFVEHLSRDPVVAPLSVNGRFEPALYVAGGKLSLGFVAGHALITE